MDALRRTLAEAIKPEGAGLLWVHEAPGMVARHRLLEVENRVPTVYFAPPSLPDGVAREAFRDTLHRRLGVALDPLGDWSDLLKGLPRDRPLMLVFDGVSELVDARKGWGLEVGRGWRTLREAGVSLTVVLIDRDARALEKLRGVEGGFRPSGMGLPPDRSPAPGVWHSLAPGDYGALAKACPDWDATQVALGFGLFGASDRALACLDPGVRVSTNVKRLLLTPGAPLFDAPLDYLRRRFQSPARYGAVVRALAHGGEKWPDIVRALDGELPANALTPYVTRLRDLGMVTDRRSLDAAVRSRKSRYRLTDPLFVFWWNRIAPLRNELLDGSMSQDVAWAALRSQLEPFMMHQANRILEAWVAHYSAGALGWPPREVGGLWGEGYDIPTAATLTNGAVGYADLAWSGSEVETAFARIESGLRFTRYGYGREARLRIVMAREDPDPETLQRIRSDPLRRLVTLEDAVKDTSLA